MGAAVKFSEDFARIVRMPRREVSRERGEWLSKKLSPLLLTAAGKRHPVWSKGLNFLQALSIDEAVEQDGAYLQLPVGAGKTLLTWLFAYIFDAENPVLVVPESLIEKTHLEFAGYRKYWVTPARPPRVLGLRQLTQEHNVNLLRRIGADLYLLDEVDVLKNQNSSMTKRIARDIDERDVRTVAMSGTGGRFSILDISHMLTWALKENAPVPLDFEELERWADALDERSTFEGFGKARKRRTAPGKLLELARITGADFDLSAEEYEDLPEIGLARATFRKRLNQTRGCIISDTDSCDKKLTIKLSTAPRDGVIEEAFREFREHNMSPAGEDVIDSLQFWALSDAIGAGYCPRWKKPPPDWWADARKDYVKLCAHIIRRTAYSQNPKDTAKAVRNAFGEHPIIKEWMNVKNEWKGKRETIWHSSSVVNAAAKWARATHGIVWTKSLAFGEALADATGLPFYGAEGEDAAGRSIERDDGGRTIICSIASNMRGRNLQDRWWRNLVIGGVQSARYNEQLFGRTHRFGQEHDVTQNILLTSGGSLYSFQRAIIEARFVHATQGHRQKLLRATHIPCVLPSNEERWAVDNAA